MQFAFMTEPQAGGTYEELLTLARWAESAGFDSFTRSDHYLDHDRSTHATDALTSLAGLARETDSITLTCLMTPITFRHPAVIAKSAATIDEMSAGRFELGVGAGWMVPEHELLGIHLPSWRERFSRQYETLAYLRAALSGEPDGYRGRHFELAEIRVRPPRTGPLPLIVGGTGPTRTPALAGRFAEEYNLFSCNQEDQQARVKVMAEAAEDAGRDPSNIRLSMMGSPIIGDTEADVEERIAVRAARRGTDPSAYAELLENRAIPVGTPEQVAEAFAGLEARGIGRYYLQVYQPLGEIDLDEVSRTLAIAKGR